MEDAQGITTAVDGPERVFILPRRRRDARLIVAGAGLGVVATGILLGLAFLTWKARHVGIVLEYWYLLLAALGLFKQAAGFLMPGRAEVRIIAIMLFARTRERFGRTTMIPDIRAVVRLEIEELRGWRAFFFPAMAKLSAEFSDGRRTLIADAYPRTVLQALAAMLRPALCAPVFDPDSPPRESGPAPEVVDVSGIPLIARDVLGKPAGCRIVESSEEGSTTFLLPRWGVLYSWPRYIGFNVVAVLMASLPALVILGLYQTHPVNRPNGWGIVVAVAAVMIGVVLAIMLAGFHVFRRRTALIVEASTSGGKELVVMSRGPLGGRERVWPAREIRWISTVRNASSNSFTVQSSEFHRLSLCIKPGRGRRRVLADGRELEMRWLGTQLRLLLEVPNIGSAVNEGSRFGQSGAGRVGQ